MSEEKKMPIMDDFLKALENRNYNRIAILSEMLKDRKVVVMDDEVGEEYKSLQDEIIKPIN